MLLRFAALLLVGFSAGIGVSAGTFAFLLVIHVIPRIIQKTKLERKVIFLENTIITGILLGTLLSLFDWSGGWLPALWGNLLLLIFGSAAGVFVGCTAIALAEILDTFPIFFRRLRIQENRAWILIFSMAIGKSLGALLYFWFGY